MSRARTVAGLVALTGTTVMVASMMWRRRRHERPLGINQRFLENDEFVGIVPAVEPVMHEAVQDLMEFAPALNGEINDLEDALIEGNHEHQEVREEVLADEHQDQEQQAPDLQIEEGLQQEGGMENDLLEEGGVEGGLEQERGEENGPQQQAQVQDDPVEDVGVEERPQEERRVQDEEEPGVAAVAPSSEPGNGCWSLASAYVGLKACAQPAWTGGIEKADRIVSETAARADDTVRAAVEMATWFQVGTVSNVGWLMAFTPFSSSTGPTDTPEQE